MDLFQKFVEKAAPSKWGVPLTIVLYLILASIVTLVQRPTEDDMQHTNIAETLLTTGRIALPIMLPAAQDDPRFIKSDQHFYALPPGAYFLLASWFKIFGIGLFQLKFFGVFFGGIALWGWILLFKKIGIENKKVLFVTALLMGVSFIYTRFTASRPYEAIGTALLCFSILSYFHWRSTSLATAILTSQFLIAIACSIHPNGLLGWAEVAFLIFYLDSKKLKWSHLLYYSFPYFILGIMAVIYISQDFDLFKMQFLANRHHHASPVLWNLFKDTFRHELFLAYGWTATVPPAAKIVGFIFLLHIVSYLILCLNQRSEFPIRLVLLLSAIHFFFFAFITPNKEPNYVVYFIPLFSVVTALAWNALYEKSSTLKPLFSGAILISILISVAVNLYRLRRNEYWKLYRPDIKAIHAMLSPTDMVYGPHELAFEIPTKQFRADWHLGYYTNQKARFVVLDEFGWRAVKQVQEKCGPEIRAYIQQIFDNSELVYQGQIYKVYKNKTLSLN